MSHLLLALLAPAFANSSGKTGSSVTGCGGGGCHSTTASSVVTSTFSPSTVTAAPGDVVSLSFIVSSTSSSHRAGGLDVSASGGTLAAGSGTQILASELTHTHDQRFSGTSATFAFTWTAPTVEGTYTLFGSGLAINDDHAASSVDEWDLTTLTITVDDGCDDFDLDGFEACEDGSGLDCDDGDVGIFPGAGETCDGADEDCDGSTDESPTDGTEYWPDVDGDGYGDAGAVATRSCTVLEGYVTEASDCDDGDLAVNPASTERCNGVDDDCDGTVDGPGSADAVTFYADLDADGYGDAASPTPECSVPTGYSADATDCDDTRATVNPGTAEVCDTLGRDEDCDGTADDADADVTGTSTFYGDADGDGYGAPGSSVHACLAPAGYAASTTDCDDANAAFNPGASETDCSDPNDYNCDGSTGYTDGDGDGYAACEDCDDATAGSHPGATETCDGADDDCDGHVDEADAADATLWFVDADADGWGSLDAYQLACDAPAGYASTSSDCADSDGGVRPDAPEVWYDGVDQDCDGADDDQDGDGFALADECDDTDAAMHPGAADAPYDAVDADCAGGSDNDADGDGQDSASHGGEDCDDADATVYVGAPDAPYDGVIHDCDDADEYDYDGDGFELGEDCDDANSAINPDADEVWYDGVDQDCDLNDDDQDGDGVAMSVDCDDEDAALLTDCDTGAPIPEEEEEEEEDEDDAEGCGCDTPGGGVLGLWGVVLAAGLARRRG